MRQGFPWVGITFFGICGDTPHLQLVFQVSTLVFAYPVVRLTLGLRIETSQISWL